MPDAEEQMRMDAHTQLVMLQRAIAQVSPDDPALADVRALLDKLGNHRYTVAVVGEFNRGKSTLINALLGMPVLPADVTPTTATVNRIVYANQPGLTLRMRNGEEEHLPIQALSARITKLNADSEAASQLVREAVIGYPTVFCRDHVSILDTPGLNESEEMDELTLYAARQADALIFVIHALIPYSMSEARLLCKLLDNAAIQNIMFTVSFIDQVQKEPGMEERVLSTIAQRIQRMTLPLIAQCETWSEEEKEQKKAMLQNAPVLGVSAKKALDAFISGDSEDLRLSRIEAYKLTLMTRLTAQQRAWEERELFPYLRRSAEIYQEAVQRRKESLSKQIDTAQKQLQTAWQMRSRMIASYNEQSEAWYKAVVSMSLPQEEEVLRMCVPTKSAPDGKGGAFVHTTVANPFAPLIQGMQWLKEKSFQKGVYRDSTMAEGQQLRADFDEVKARIASIWIPAVNENAAEQYARCYAKCQEASEAYHQALNQAAQTLCMSEISPAASPLPPWLLLENNEAVDTLAFPIWGNLDKVDKATERLQKHLRNTFRKEMETKAQRMKKERFACEPLLSATTEALKGMEQQMQALQQQLEALMPRAETVEKIIFGSDASDAHEENANRMKESVSSSATAKEEENHEQRQQPQQEAD